MLRMPWTSKSSPHFVLEVNQKCNISCRGCYKKMDGSTKSLDQIEDELRIALSCRKIHTVSIAGGEPTLYPQLCEIVEIIHKKNLKVALLTNGLLLDDNFLKELKNSGLDIIMFHIDEGQNRPDLNQNSTIDEVNSLRSTFTKQAAAKGIDTGLCVTIYREYFDRVPKLIDFVLNSEQINFLLATNYVDISHLIEYSQCLKDNKPELCENRVSPQLKRTNNQEIKQVFRDNFGLEPFAYLPTDKIINEKEDSLEWMTYFVPAIYFNNKTERFKMKSSLADSFLVSIPKFITGRFMFYCKPNPLLIGVQVFFNAFTTKRLIQGLRFFSKLKYRGAHLGAKRLIFENGPMLNKDGNIGCCIFCPNATIRDNKLVHLCLADYLHLEKN